MINKLSKRHEGSGRDAAGRVAEGASCEVVHPLTETEPEIRHRIRRLCGAGEDGHCPCAEKSKQRAKKDANRRSAKKKADTYATRDAARLISSMCILGSAVIKPMPIRRATDSSELARFIERHFETVNVTRNGEWARINDIIYPELYVAYRDITMKSAKYLGWYRKEIMGKVGDKLSELFSRT